MCTVAAGSWGGGVRVWEDMSLGRRPRRGARRRRALMLPILSNSLAHANAVARLPERKPLRQSRDHKSCAILDGSRRERSGLLRLQNGRYSPAQNERSCG